MPSRKTRLLRGLAAGPRKAGDSAMARSEGTVRPEAAMICCPSGELANSMNAQLAVLFAPAFGMQ